MDNNKMGQPNTPETPKGPEKGEELKPSSLLEKYGVESFQELKGKANELSPEDRELLSRLLSERKAKREKAEGKSFEDVSTFEDLSTRIKALAGDEMGFTADELEMIVEKVQEGEVPLDFVTNKYGLRKALQALMEKEKQEELERVREIATKKVKDDGKEESDEEKEEGEEGKEKEGEGKKEAESEKTITKKNRAPQSPLERVYLQKSHYEKRRIGYIKNILKYYADANMIRNRKTKKNLFSKMWRFLTASESNEKIKQQYERALQIIEKDVSEMSEEDKKFLLSLNLRRFVNEKGLNEKFARDRQDFQKQEEELKAKIEKLPEGEERAKLEEELKKLQEQRTIFEQMASVEKYTMMREKTVLMRRKLRDIEGKIFKEETRGKFFKKIPGTFKLGWKRFKLWWSDQEHRRIIKRGARIAGAMAVLTGLGINPVTWGVYYLGSALGAGSSAPTALGVLTALKLTAGRYVGARTAQEIAASLYRRGKRDNYQVYLKEIRDEYYNKLTKIRREITDPEELKKALAEAEREYKEKTVQKLPEISVKQIKKSNRGETWVRIAFALFGSLLTGALQRFHLFHGDKVEAVSPNLENKLHPAGMEQHPHGDPNELIQNHDHATVSDITHEHTNIPGVPDHVNKEILENIKEHTPFVYNTDALHQHISADKIPSEAFIQHHGDGISWIVKRQLEANPDLKKAVFAYFGIKMDDPHAYGKLMEYFGYKDIGIFDERHHFYAIVSDSNGRPIILEGSVPDKSSGVANIFEYHEYNPDIKGFESHNTGIHNPDNIHPGEDQVGGTTEKATERIEYNMGDHHHTPKAPVEHVSESSDIPKPSLDDKGPAPTPDPPKGDTPIPGPKDGNNGGTLPGTGNDGGHQEVIPPKEPPVRQNPYHYTKEDMHRRGRNNFWAGFFSGGFLTHIVDHLIDSHHHAGDIGHHMHTYRGGIRVPTRHVRRVVRALHETNQ